MAVGLSRSSHADLHRSLFRSKMGIRVVMVRRGVRRHACFQCSGLWVPTMPSPHADLRKLVDQAAEPVASSDAEVVLRRRGKDLGPGWCLAERPMRPVGVVVVDVAAEGMWWRCRRLAMRMRSVHSRRALGQPPG